MSRIIYCTITLLINETESLSSHRSIGCGCVRLVTSPVAGPENHLLIRGESQRKGGTSSSPKKNLDKHKSHFKSNFTHIFANS